VPLHAYPAGSYGPAAADELLARDGYHWWFDDKQEEKSAMDEGERYAYYANY